MTNKNSKIFEQSILATIIYYDCLDVSLTSFEIWQKLIKSIKERNVTYSLLTTHYSLYEVLHNLEHSEYLKIHISQKNGFWFLNRREELAMRRIEVAKESEEKLKKVFWYRWAFEAVPFLEGVFVSGSTAGGWAKKESDIDVLVVARQGRIWTVRFFLTLWTTFLGIRRRGDRIMDRVCLNHYIINTSLAIPFQSFYNAHTYIHFIPLINKGNVFEKFFQKNRWIENYFFNNLEKRKEERCSYVFPRPPLLETCIKIERYTDEFILSGFLGDMLENFARHIQIHFIKKNPLTKTLGGRIRAGESQLEFHPRSKERVILEAYNKKLKEYELNDFYPEKDSGLTS